MLLLLALILAAPTNESKTIIIPSKSYFGILLSTTTMGYDMTFAVITEEADGRKSHKHITRQEFVYIAQGQWRLKPNFQQENLFEKYGIPWGYDDRNRLHCPILDSLWKVRYREFPYIRGSFGWANDVYMPSAEQQLYLFENFGVYNVNNNFFEGDNMWKLLQSLTSEEWKAMYKSL
jgi:hypothetical protein